MVAAAAALVVVIAVVAGTVRELRLDGSRRRPYDPTYNSRTPS